MEYKDLKPLYKIGNTVFLIHNDMVHKTVILGIKIFPFPNPDINPFRYLIFTPNGDEREQWVEEMGMFNNIEDLKEYTFDCIADEEASYESVAETNAFDVQLKMSKLK